MILNEASREIQRQYLDCSKARALLGWKSPRSLEEGLAQTLEWYRRHLGAR